MKNEMPNLANNKENQENWNEQMRNAAEKIDMAMDRFRNDEEDNNKLDNLG